MKNIAEPIPTLKGIKWHEWHSEWFPSWLQLSNIIFKCILKNVWSLPIRRIIHYKFYDSFHGGDIVNEAVRFFEVFASIKILIAGILFRKFLILISLGKQKRIDCGEINIDGNPLKVLGLIWDSKKDILKSV